MVKKSMSAWLKKGVVKRIGFNIAGKGRGQ
jgi:hypothetical protein